MYDSQPKRSLPAWLWRVVGAAFIVVVLLEAAIFLNVQARFRPAPESSTLPDTPAADTPADSAAEPAVQPDIAPLPAPAIYPEFAPEMSTLPALVPVPDPLGIAPAGPAESSAPAPAVSTGSSVPPGSTSNSKPPSVQPPGQENKTKNTGEGQSHGKGKDK